MSISKKIITLVVLIILAGGAAVFLTKKSKDSDQSVNTGTNTPSEPVAKSNSKTYSPTEVLGNINTYTNHEVALTGSLTQIDSKDYYLVSSGRADPNKPSAIRLDFGNTGIDANKYANPGSRNKGTPTDNNASEIKPPVTVTGKLVQKDPKSEPYLEVISIK